MPRISFDYPSVNEWSETTGNGSSTFDICTKCFQIDSHQLIIKLGGPYNGEPNPLQSEPLSHHDIGEDNPSLHEDEPDDVYCNCCNNKLVIGRNY
jgi:hypothetical protein